MDPSNPLLEKSVKQWRFDEITARIFEDHIRKSVPFYDEIHRMIAEVSDWFLHDSSLVYDLGASTGEAIRRTYDRHAGKKLKFIAVDASKDMIQKAKEKLFDVPDVQFLISDLNNPFRIENASIVLSILTLQFLEPRSRPRLLKEIFNGLQEGGALILVEKVMGNTPRFDEMWVDLHHDMKRRNGISDYEISVKNQALRGVLLPYSLRANTRLVRQAGFQEIDLFFKWYNWAGIIAIK